MIEGLAAERAIEKRDSLFVHVLLQQILQTERRPLLGLARIIRKLGAVVEEEVGAGKRLAPGREILLAHGAERV